MGARFGIDQSLKDLEFHRPLENIDLFIDFNNSCGGQQGQIPNNQVNRLINFPKQL